MRYSTITHPDAEKSGVYLIRNLDTNRVYVGATGQKFRRRWVRHLWDLRKGVHTCAALQVEWKLSHRSRFQFEVVEIVSGPTLRQREQFHIDHLYREGTLLYNVMPAWAPPPAPHPTEEALYTALYDLLPDF